MRSLLALCAVAFVPVAAVFPSEPDSPIGVWAAYDEDSSTPKGVMRIFQQGDLFFGRNEKIPTVPDQRLRCTRCRDDRKDQLVVGMIIMRNMRLDHGEYSGGDILDPRTGHVYDCKFRLAEGGERLILRGFLGISLLGGSQVWRRVNAPVVRP